MPIQRRVRSMPRSAIFVTYVDLPKGNRDRDGKGRPFDHSGLDVVGGGTPRAKPPGTGEGDDRRDVEVRQTTCSRPAWR